METRLIHDRGNSAPRQIRKPTAFTLVEMLVGLAVFLLVAVLLANLVSQATSLWHGSEDQKARQQSARLVFERMTRELEGAVFPLDTTNSDRFFFLVNPEFAAMQNPQAIFWQTLSSGDGSRGDISEVEYFVRWKEIDGRPVAELCRIEVPPDAADALVNGSGESMTQEKVERYAPPTIDPANPMKGVLARNVVGLWVKLYNKDGEISTPYDSSSATDTPTSVEVSLALMDTRTAGRLTNPEEITAHYGPSPTAFLASLPESLRQGVRILTVRSRLEASKP